MVYGRSDPYREDAADLAPVAVKIIVAGGFGVGKTTLIGSISEIRPLRTEEVLTDRGVPVDHLAGVEAKLTTTVAMDFGRISFGDDLVLYLFGTPGQERFWFMWDELCYGALGAVVLADTRRLPDCFPSVDYFEQRRIDFLVAVNCFEGALRHDPADVRTAQDLHPGQVRVVPAEQRVRQVDQQVPGQEPVARVVPGRHRAGRRRHRADRGRADHDDPAHPGRPHRRDDGSGAGSGDRRVPPGPP